MGRAICKLIDLYHPVKALIHLSDDWEEEMKTLGEVPDIAAMEDDEERAKWQEMKSACEAVRLLPSIIPNAFSQINKASAEELKEWSEKLNKGAASARGDDVNRLKIAVAGWLNTDLDASPTISHTDREGRGLHHPLCGRLLCSAEYNWDDPECMLYLLQKVYSLTICALRVVAKIRNCHIDYPLGPTANALFHRHQGDPSDVEKGYLRSALLVKTWKHIFTSPSSANDVSTEDASGDENPPPAGRQRTAANKKKATKSVASTVNLTHVAPRSIAYAAVQLLLALSSAPGYVDSYQGLSFRDTYYYIVDFFDVEEGTPSHREAAALLEWWDRQAFPHQTSQASRGAANAKRRLAEQRARKAAASASVS